MREGSAIEFVIEMLRQGFGLLGEESDVVLHRLIPNTLRLAFESTAIALLLGLPLAYWIAGGNSRPRRATRMAANAGLGLPPVGVGVYAFLLMPGSTPWGGHWYGTWNAIILVQTILAVPIIVALVGRALLDLSPGLVEQARAFGASGWRLAAFTLREAKVGVLAAVIVSLASAVGEVGAITIVSSNSGAEAPTATLAVTVLNDAATGGDGWIPVAVMHALVTLALLLVLGGVLTLVQQARRRPLGARVRAPGRRAVHP